MRWKFRRRIWEDEKNIKDSIKGCLDGIGFVVAMSMGVSPMFVPAGVGYLEERAADKRQEAGLKSWEGAEIAGAEPYRIEGRDRYGYWSREFIDVNDDGVYDIGRTEGAFIMRYKLLGKNLKEA
jgi:hypothetical protein